MSYIVGYIFNIGFDNSSKAFFPYKFCGIQFKMFVLPFLLHYLAELKIFFNAFKQSCWFNKTAFMFHSTVIVTFFYKLLRIVLFPVVSIDCQTIFHIIKKKLHYHASISKWDLNVKPFAIFLTYVSKIPVVMEVSFCCCFTAI